MSHCHDVKQGEHSSRIAWQHGFTDYRKVWDSAENANLRARRSNPHILYPGDQLQLPEKEKKEEPGETGQRHRFRVRSQPLKLVLRLAHRHADVLSECEGVLAVSLELHLVRTDAEGGVETGIDHLDEDASLCVQEDVEIGAHTLVAEHNLVLRIGHLDPVDTESGQLGRLGNLGFYPHRDGEIDTKLFLAAVEEFQCENGLQVDGICGPLTQARLEEVHGS